MGVFIHDGCHPPKLWVLQRGESATARQTWRDKHCRGWLGDEMLRRGYPTKLILSKLDNARIGPSSWVSVWTTTSKVWFWRFSPLSRLQNISSWWRIVDHDWGWLEMLGPLLQIHLDSGGGGGGQFFRSFDLRWISLPCNGTTHIVSLRPRLSKVVWEQNRPVSGRLTLFSDFQQKEAKYLQCSLGSMLNWLKWLAVNAIGLNTNSCVPKRRGQSHSNHSWDWH